MSRSKINPQPVVAQQSGESRGRFSAGRKTQAVLRLLKGEDLEALSRELKVTAATLSQWREAFLAAGQASLKSRAADERDEQITRLQSKVGEMTMEVELLNEKIDRMEAGVPFAARRSPPESDEQGHFRGVDLHGQNLRPPTRLPSLAGAAIDRV